MLGSFYCVSAAVGLYSASMLARIDISTGVVSSRPLMVAGKNFVRLINSYIFGKM